MQQSSRPHRVDILRGVQRRCVWVVWRLGCVAGLRRGGSGHCLRHRCDRPTHSDANPTQNAPVWRSGRLNSHRPHTRHDKTVLSVSCLAWQCELGIRKTVSAGQECHCRDQDSAVSVATVPLESLQQAGQERYHWRACSKLDRNGTGRSSPVAHG